MLSFFFLLYAWLERLSLSEIEACAGRLCAVRMWGVEVDSMDFGDKADSLPGTVCL